MSNLIISALDQSPIRDGDSAVTAIQETVELAKLCDQLGYHRYWLAEHHSSSSFAGTAPEILIAYLAAATQNIRIGSGGVMISHYSPLKIAEQFRLLEALAPGRIDLGIGRAPGSDPKTSAALQSGPQAWPGEVFPQQLEMIRQFLADAEGKSGEQGGFPDDHPYLGIHAQPGGNSSPNIWLLGSGGDSAIFAAQFGLPYVYAHFIGGQDGVRALDVYRRNFRPSAHCKKPVIGFAMSLLVAESQEQADYYSLPRNIWALQHQKNQSSAFLRMEDAANFKIDDADQATFEQIQARSLTGTPDNVYTQLCELQQLHEIDEFFSISITSDNQARHNSYRLLADAAGLVSPSKKIHMDAAQ